MSLGLASSELSFLLRLRGFEHFQSLHNGKKARA